MSSSPFATKSGFSFAGVSADSGGQGEMKLLPKGEYTGEVKTAELVRKDAGKVLVKLVLDIKGYPNLLFEYFGMEGYSEDYVIRSKGRILFLAEANGMTAEQLESKHFPKNLEGLKWRGYVSIQESKNPQYGDKNVLSRFMELPKGGSADDGFDDIPF